MSKIVVMWQYGAIWYWGLNVMSNLARVMRLWSTLHCQEHYGKREVNIQYALHSWLMPAVTACVKLGLLVGHFVGFNLISCVLHGEGRDPEGVAVNSSYWTSVSVEIELHKNSWLWLNDNDWWIGSDIVMSGSGLSWLPVIFFLS
jgi:hypothetical protein